MLILLECCKAELLFSVEIVPSFFKWLGAQRHGNDMLCHDRLWACFPLRWKKTSGFSAITAADSFGFL